MNTTLPKIESYGKYSSGNYGVHSLMIHLGSLDVYYSYDTIIAYWDQQDGLVCSQNVWSTTTGKHLNWIQPDHSLRINAATFEDKLAAAIARHIN